MVIIPVSVHYKHVNLTQIGHIVTVIDTLAQAARETLTDCYTLTIADDTEQHFMGDIDNVTLAQAISVYERNRLTLLEDVYLVPGTRITLYSIHGIVREYVK